MTAEELLIRDEKPGVQPKVTIHLTPQVVGSLTALAPLVGWAWAHREIIEGPRRRAGAREMTGRAAS